MRKKQILIGIAVLFLVVLGVIWWRYDFTLDFNRFFAAPPDYLSVQCGATQNVLTWTYNDLANSNSIQRGGPAFLPKNLPDCADYWCWLPTIDYPHQLPTPGNPATYIDTQPMQGVCHEYRIKYQPILPSNSVFCPTGCNLPPPTTPPPTPTACPIPTPPGPGCVLTPAPVPPSCISAYQCPTPTPSTPAPVITLTATPGAVVCTGDDPRPTILNWSIVPGAQTYNVSRGTTSGGPYTAIASGLTAPPHADPAQAGTFYYVVSAFDAGGVLMVTSSEVQTDIPTPSCATPAPPTVDIKCSVGSATPTDGPCTVTSGSTSTLTWTSANATSCTASGGWTGARVPQGSEPSPVLTSSQTFTLTCTGPGGTASDQVTVNVSAAPTHLECSSNACVQVAGAGANQCAANADCAAAALRCAPANTNTQSGQDVAVTGSGGTPAYTWSATGGNPASGAGTPFTTRFTNTTQASRIFPITLTDSAGATSTCNVTVACRTPSCVPSSGCSYQNGSACSCGTLVCPPSSPLSCAPATQTVQTGQQAAFASGGGSANSVTWSAPGGTPSSGSGSDRTFSTSFNVPGTYAVTVSGGGQSATCSVQVQATATPPPATTPALTMQKTVRNVSSAGVEGENANAAPGQTVEFIIRVSSVGSGTATQVTVRDVLPAGLTYAANSTTIDGVAAPDGITGSGLSVGDMPVGRAVTIRFRATLAAASFFGTGTTVLTNTATAQAAGASASAATNVQNTAQVSVVNGATTPTQVPTGPGETTILALVISAIATLLYVGYASTATFTRREAESLAHKGRDDIDSLNFRR